MITPIKSGELFGYRRSSIQKNLSAREWSQFCRFMEGQTVAMLPDGDTLIYYDDWQRFIHNLPVID